MCKETPSIVEEGWVLKEMKKSYRFNERQKAYLETKLNIGQTMGQKLDGKTVAREMRRSTGPDGNCLFRVSKILAAQQVSSFFSHLAAKSRNDIQVDDDICAFEEESNFSTTRQDILSHFQIEHPIVYNQYNICALVSKGTQENLVYFSHFAKALNYKHLQRELEARHPTSVYSRKWFQVALAVAFLSSNFKY